MLRSCLLAALVATLSLTAVAVADHVAGKPCSDCVNHDYWPRIDRDAIQKAPVSGGELAGGAESDELLGWHGDDVLRGKGHRDILWGDHMYEGNTTKQFDRIYGGSGTDFIYASHGRNRIFGGKGNDAISGHFGRGLIDCGPGRDIYHVARMRKKGWTIRNCEKVDYRSEAQRGGKGLKPLPKKK